MDIDKEYEVYEASLSKKARDKFKDNADAVSSVNKWTLQDKLARIMMFGGNMELEDVDSWRAGADPDLDPDAGKPVDFKYDLFTFGISGYLEKCEIFFDFSVKPLSATDIKHFSWGSLFGWMNGMSDFKMMFEGVDKSFIEKVIVWLRSNGIDFKSGISEKMEHRTEVLQNSHEEFWVVSCPDTFKSKPDIGEMAFLVNREDDQYDACLKYAENVIEFVKKKFSEEKFKDLENRIEKTFDYLSHSSNVKCWKAMNEGIVHKVIDKFKERVNISPTSSVENIDVLKDKIESIVDSIYKKKIADLEFSDGSRDLVSGISVANTFFFKMGDVLNWRVSVVSAAKADPIYFDSGAYFKTKRSNANIENRFISMQTYGLLKRNYMMNKTGKTTSCIYYAKIEPLIPIMKSDKAFFKDGFVFKKYGPKMNEEQTVEILYDICCYMRDNLVDEEWQKFSEFIDKKAAEFA